MTPDPGTAPEPPPVLVVEDEVFIRMVAADTLADQGLTIYEAGNADEALRILEEHPEIGVLFTDVRMPGSMDGLQLAERVAATRPDIKIIVTSGHQQPNRSAIPADGTFLPKPYVARGLIWAVDETPPPAP